MLRLAPVALASPYGASKERWHIGSGPGHYINDIVDILAYK
jgi:hypothetical protein